MYLVSDPEIKFYDLSFVYIMMPGFWSIVAATWQVHKMRGLFFKFWLVLPDTKFFQILACNVKVSCV